MNVSCIWGKKICLRTYRATVFVKDSPKGGQRQGIFRLLGVQVDCTIGYRQISYARHLSRLQCCIYFPGEARTRAGSRRDSPRCRTPPRGCKDTYMKQCVVFASVCRSHGHVRNAGGWVGLPDDASQRLSAASRRTSAWHSAARNGSASANVCVHVATCGPGSPASLATQRRLIRITLSRRPRIQKESRKSGSNPGEDTAVRGKRTHFAAARNVSREKVLVLRSQQQ